MSWKVDRKIFRQLKEGIMILSWMFEHDCLDTCWFGVICLCFIFLCLYIFSAFWHVSHGKMLKKYNHYYYNYYFDASCNVRDIHQLCTAIFLEI